MPAPLIPLILFGLRTGATFLAKRAAKKALKRIARKKILTDKSVRKRAKKIGQKATKQEATPPFAKSKQPMEDWGDAIRKHKFFDVPDTKLKLALQEQKKIQGEKAWLRKEVNSRIIKRMKARKPGQSGEGKPRSKRRKDVNEFDRRARKISQDKIKASEKRIQGIINELKKERKQKKRERDLKKDSEQRRN